MRTWGSKEDQTSWIRELCMYLLKVLGYFFVVGMILICWGIPSAEYERGAGAGAIVFAKAGHQV
jgi:hypothetical protein